LDLRLGATGAGARQSSSTDTGGAFRQKTAPADRGMCAPLRGAFAALAIHRLLVHLQSSRGARFPSCPILDFPDREVKPRAAPDAQIESVKSLRELRSERRAARTPLFPPAYDFPEDRRREGERPPHLISVRTGA